MNFSYRDGRLVAEETREVPDAEQPQWWRDVRVFVESLKTVPWLKPQGDPDPSWRVSETRDEATAAAMDAARETARWDLPWHILWAATRDAAGNAAWNAAWKTAKAVVGGVARETAWRAAGCAAGIAAEIAAGVEVVAGGARLQAQMLATADLDVGEEHRAHARARWAVWTRGYCLLCDVNKVLYVYRKP